MVISKLKNRINKNGWKSTQPKFNIMNRLNKNDDWRFKEAKLKVTTEVRSFRNHLTQNFWTLAISTFGIANGLVWYDVWSTIVNEFFPNRNTLLLKVYVAIIITLFTLTATYFVTKLRDRSIS
jgi:hypothetical protein